MPPEAQPRRILLAGSPRSGTEWTAGVLSSGPGARSLLEPDNINTGAGAHAASPGRTDFGAFPVLRPGDESPGYRALWEMAFAGRVPGRKGWLHPLARLVLSMPAPVRNATMGATASAIRGAPGRPRTIVVKTVMAHFALEWVVAEIKPAVVVIQRDPRNMVSSWLEWNMDGFDLHTRPAVRQACAELGLELPAVPSTHVGLTAWWVGLLSEVLGRLADRHADWIVVTHEDLCDEPETRFRDLFRRLGLEWTSSTMDFLRETGYLSPIGHTDHGLGVTHGDAATVRRQVSQKWRQRLSDGQVSEIEDVLAGFPTRGWVRIAEPVTTPVTTAAAAYSAGHAGARAVADTHHETQAKRILLAGSPRTGSIWTAHALASGPGGRCVVEPDNVNVGTGDEVRNAGATGFGAFPVLRPGEDAPGYRALWDMAWSGRVPGRRGWLHPVARLVLGLPAPLRNATMGTAASALRGAPGRPSTVVVQTVMSHFALEWIVAEAKPAVVVIQRDPRNVVSSWLEWNLDVLDLPTRPAIREVCDELGVSLPPVPVTAVGRVAWCVGLQTSVLGRHLERHPEWVLVTHEDLCRDAEARFRQLFRTLGLEWTTSTEEYLRETGYLAPKGLTDHGLGVTQGDAAAVRQQVWQKWRERLSDEQVAEIDAVLDAFPTRGWVRLTEAAPAMPLAAP